MCATARKTEDRLDSQYRNGERRTDRWGMRISQILSFFNESEIRNRKMADGYGQHGHTWCRVLVRFDQQALVRLDDRLTARMRGTHPHPSALARHLLAAFVLRSCQSRRWQQTCHCRCCKQKHDEATDANFDNDLQYQKFMPA